MARAESVTLGAMARAARGQLWEAANSSPAGSSSLLDLREQRRLPEYLQRVFNEKRRHSAKSDGALGQLRTRVAEGLLWDPLARLAHLPPPSRGPRLADGWYRRSVARLTRNDLQRIDDPSYRAYALQLFELARKQ